MLIKSKLNNADLIWSYLGKILNICSGLITLPLVLRLLTEEEIAFNYVLATLMSIAALFDFGFSPQFSRNFAFIFGGAQEIIKEGVPSSNNSQDINYQLLYRIIQSAKLLYKILSIGVCLLLLTVGTIYIYHFTEHFSLFNNCLEIWILFIASIVFDFYFRYFSTILMGKGLIKEVNQIDVLANVTRLLVVCAALLGGCGLWAIVIGNFIRLIIIRIISYRLFFTTEMNQKLSVYEKEYFDKWNILSILWFNARKTMIVCISTYACVQLGFFFSSLYLSKTEVASYGLLNQLLIIMTSFSMNVCYSLTPIYSALRAQNKHDEIKSNLYFSMGVFYILQILVSISIIVILPKCLVLIKSNAVLPNVAICVIALIYKFLENQHVVCSCYLTTQNRIIDFESSVVLGIANLIGFWSVLQFTDWGLLGIVCVQLIIPLCYPNWKWPYELCKDFKISYLSLVNNSFATVFKKVINRIPS